VSKRVTRLHGDPSAREPERGRNLMGLRPVRSVESWVVAEGTDLVVIHQPKGLSRVEARLARAVKAQEHVNRPLDRYGSAIWQLCDGQHTIEEIARALEARFHEQFEPALPRTLRFVDLLARRGLVRIAPPPSEAAAERLP